MNKKTLSAAWAVLFTLCAGLGFIPNPQGFGKAVLVTAAVCAFIPPFLLLRLGDPDTARLIRSLSALSLGLTVVLLIVNLLSVRLPESVGNFLYAMLVIVSSPMICAQYWVLSLFLWACLLFAGISKLKKKT